MTRTVRGLRRRIERLKGQRILRRLAGPRLLRAFAKANHEAVFVEVGANDGAQHDPLRPILADFPWRGIMVEPVPYVFERLRRNYGAHAGIALENAAIADRVGPLPFYHLREAAPGERSLLPAWYDGIGSFSRDTVLSHSRLIPDINERLVVTDVPCLTFDALCTKHGIAQVDVLVIDTEGYDAEVLRAVDLARWSPVVLVFEHYHLTPAQCADATARLVDAGYEVRAEGFDTWCVGPRADTRLRRAWKRMRPAVPAAFAEYEPSESGST
jgi:FkbM family methyltransferase